MKWGHRTPAGGGECMGAKWKTKLRRADLEWGVLTLGPAAHDDGCIFHSRFVESGEFSAHIVRRPHYPATLYPPQRVLDGRGGVTPGVVINTPVPLGLAEDTEDVGERVGFEPCLEGSGVAGMRGVYHPNDSDGLAEDHAAPNGRRDARDLWRRRGRDDPRFMIFSFVFHQKNAPQ